MTAWIIWFALAAILLIFDMATGTFYLLVMAVAAVAAGAAALAGMGLALQFLLAAIVGVTGTFVLRKRRSGNLRTVDSSADPNINLDIGQTLAVEEWNTATRPPTARVMYRDTPWDVELSTDAAAVPGYFIIREVHGSRLVVSNKS